MHTTTERALAVDFGECPCCGTSVGLDASGPEAVVVDHRQLPPHRSLRDRLRRFVA